MNKEDLSILLLEDHEADIELFTEILADTSYSAHKLQTAGRMSEALRILESHSIDIIVLDLHLPDSRGLETFTQLTEKYPEIPAIIYTITNDEDIALDAIRKGADDYLIKGPNLDTVQVEKSIRKAVETRKNRTAMRQTMRELERTNEYLEHFAYVASHDLNAPLINLEELHQLIDLKRNTPEYNAGIINKVSGTISQLRKTLDSLFKVLDIHEKLEATTEDVSLKATFDQVLQELSPGISASGASIYHDFSTAEQVKFPPEHLQKVMLHLLTNAIQYRREDADPEIRVRSYPHKKDYICLEVEDNGIGFDQEVQADRMFDLFNRPHKHSSGHGIGLYTIKTLVENQNGFVSARSKEPEQGSVFQVCFNKTTKTPRA